MLRPTPVAMVTKICDFQHKIGHNSACIGDMTVILGPTGSIRDGQFKGVSQTLRRLTPVAMVTKICEFKYKIGYNSICMRDITQTLTAGRGF